MNKPNFAVTLQDMGHVERIHFVGIGGTGMSGIAEVLLNLGYQVSGSDLKAGGGFGDQEGGKDPELVFLPVWAGEGAFQAFRDSPHVLAPDGDTGFTSSNRFNPEHRD